MKVASPSSQQAEHQNHTADTFHTPSFMWAFQGITPGSSDQAAKRDRGMTSQVKLSVHMGMWNLIYRRESRRSRAWNQSPILSGWGPVSSDGLYTPVPHCIYHSSPVTGHNSSHLPTAGRYFPSFFSSLWARGGLVLMVGPVPLSACWWIRPAGHSRKTKEKAPTPFKSKEDLLSFPMLMWSIT